MKKTVPQAQRGDHWVKVWTVRAAGMGLSVFVFLTTIEYVRQVRSVGARHAWDLVRPGGVAVMTCPLPLGTPGLYFPATFLAPADAFDLSTACSKRAASFERILRRLGEPNLFTRMGPPEAYRLTVLHASGRRTSVRVERSWQRTAHLRSVAWSPTQTGEPPDALAVRERDLSEGEWSSIHAAIGRAHLRKQAAEDITASCDGTQCLLEWREADDYGAIHRLRPAGEFRFLCTALSDLATWDAASPGRIKP